MKIERKKIIHYCAIIILLYLIMKYWNNILDTIGVVIDAFTPIIVGGIIAYIVNIVMEIYEKKVFYKLKGKRAISMIMAFASIILVVCAIVGVVLPELKSCIEILAKNMPKTFDKIENFINTNYSKLPKEITKDINLEAIDWDSLSKSAIKWFKGGFGSTVGTVIGYLSSIFSIIVSLIVGFIFSIYLLADKDKLRKQAITVMNTYLGEKICEKIYYILRIFHNSMHSFIVGQCIEAVILGSLCAIGMLILRLPYAGMIGVLIGSVSLIPIVGVYTGGTIGAIMIFTVSPVKAVVFIVFLITLIQFETQLIYPRVVGSSIGLPGIWVFSAVVICGGMFGVPGILLGIPCVSAMYKILLNDLRKRDVIEPEKVKEKNIAIKKIIKTKKNNEK